MASESGDREVVRADFTKVSEAARAAAAKANEATGALDGLDEKLTLAIEKVSALAKVTGEVTSPGSVEDVTAAIEAQNAARSAGTELAREQLSTEERINAALAQRTELLAAQSRTGMVPVTSGGGVARQAAAESQASAGGVMLGEQDEERSAALAIEQAIADAATRELALQSQITSFKEQQAALGASIRESMAQAAASEEAMALSAQRVAEQEALAAEAARQQAAAEAEAATQRQKAMGFLTESHVQAGVARAQGTQPPLMAQAAVARPTNYVGDLSAGEQAALKYQQALATITTTEADASMGTSAFSNELTRLGSVQAQASSEMRTHGALTTEFISALARGETTVAEFGYQISATIGKFAGWTAAATATYGALGAIVEIGKGAIDSASGVTQLSRTIDNVNTGKAAQQFNDLSKEMNVSINQASDAVFQFSRTFHNQDDAVTAAGVGLMAYKLDAVDVATSVQALTAVHQQFGLSAAELPGLFDMLAKGQSEFNARVSQSIPLITRSAAAVKNAGGNLQQLVQISTLALRVTGQTGPQIGTALARSAANFEPKPADLDMIQSLGINTNQGYTQVLEDAIKRAAALSGEQRAELAKAFGGPQLGSKVFAPLFEANPSLVAQVTKTITPEGSAGAAAKELQPVLREASQEIDHIGIALQRIGADIAGTGLLTPFGLFLRMLDTGLDAVDQLVQQFDKLPEPIRTGLSLLLEVKAVMALLSRTQIGASIASATGLSKIPGVGPSQSELMRQDLTTGTRTALTGVEKDIEQMTTQLNAVGRASVQMKAESQRLTDSIAGMADGSEEQMAAMNRANSIDDQIRANKLKQAILEGQIADAAQEALVQSARLNLLQNRQLSEQQIGTLHGNVYGADTAAGAGVAGSTAASTASKSALTAAQRAEVAALDAQAAADLKLAESEAAVSVAAGAAGVSAAAVTEGAAAATTATAGLAVEAETSAAATTSWAVRGKAAMGAMFGVGLIAYLAGSSLLSSLKGYETSSSTALDALDRVNGTTAQVFQQMQANINSLQKEPSFFARMTDQLVAGAVHVFAGGDGTTLQQANYQAGAAAQNLLSALKTQAGATKDSPFYMVGQSLQTLEGMAQSDLKEFQSGQETYAALQKQLAELMRSTSRSSDAVLAPSGGAANQEVAAAKQRIQQAAAAAASQVDPSKSDPFSEFDKLTTGASGVLTEIQGIEDHMKAFGSNAKDIKSIATGFEFLAKTYANTVDTSKDSLAPLVQAQSAYSQGITDSAQDQLDNALAMARNPGQVTQAYSKALAQVRQGATAASIPFKAIAKDTEDAKAKLNSITQQYQAELSADKLFPGSQDQDSTLKSLAAQEAAAEAAYQKALDTQNRVSAANRQAIGLIDKWVKSTQDAAYQALQSNLAVQVAYANSMTSDKTTQTINTLQSDETLVSKAIATYGAHATQTLQAITQANTDRQAKVQQQLADLQAQDTLKTSDIQGTGPTGDLARNQSSLQGDKNTLAFEQAHPGTYSKQDIEAAMTAINNDKLTIAQSVTSQMQSVSQEAAALLAAQSTLAQSETSNPVAQAKAAMQAAVKSLALIKPSDYTDMTQYQTALLQGQAAVNNAKTTTQQAIVQQDLDNLAFEDNIGKIGDQQYIDGLQKILAMKKLSIAQRQQIEEQIYQLKNGSSGSLDLNTTSIQIPSVYQIRRAIGLGQSGVIPGGNGGNVVVNHTATVIVNVKDSHDVPAVGRAIDKHLGTSTMSAARAAGVL